MSKIIEVKNLNFAYNNDLVSKLFFKKPKVIFKDFNFTLNEGETVIIAGKNGIGKTTLLSIVTGLLPLKTKDSGEINFYLDEKYANPFQAIGLGFQLTEYPSGFKVNTMIKLLFPKINTFEDVQKYYPEDAELFDILNIKEIFNSKIKRLSGGQKQKLTLLFGLYNNPKILLLDEFTNHLDIGSKLGILEYIKKKSKEEKLSILFVTHNFDEISSLANKILIIKNPTEYDLYDVENVDPVFISELVKEIE